MKITDYGKRAVCFPEEKRTRKGVRGKLVGGAGCWLGDIADLWDVLSHTSPAPLLHITDMAPPIEKCTACIR